MNILIPMGGLGSRFANAGYRSPKPLILVAGRPMVMLLLDELSVDSQKDIIWVAFRDTLDRQYALGDRLKQEYPELDIRIIHLHYDTRGAAETLWIIIQHMSPLELSRPTISLDCDTIYFTDILTQFRQQSHHHVIFYFEEMKTNGPAVYSYSTITEDGKVIAIKEKERISSYANTGAYGFTSATILAHYCALVMSHSIGGNGGEYYISAIFKYLLEAKDIIEGIYVSNFACLGTPIQLQQFYIRVSQGEIIFKKSIRVCVDLDGTLVTLPTIAKDYTTCQPIKGNINLVQALKKAGRYIIIYTARRMKTHQGDIQKVIADIGEITKLTLEKFEIPYDELIFGKPWADVYLDDRAINAIENPDREIGWLETLSSSSSSRKLIPIPPRPYHQVQILEDSDTVIKKGNDLQGEISFYNTLPNVFIHYFPLMLGHIESSDNAPAELWLQYIHGIPYAQLLRDRAITEQRLSYVLDALYRFHHYDPLNRLPIPGHWLYENYIPKLEKRMQTGKHVYDRLGLIELDQFYLRLMNALHQYNRAYRVTIIHGDPVFTNVFSTTSEEQVKFVDPRGKLGDTYCTLQGDATYDLAKIYQSLCGYDLILQGENVNEYTNYLAYLQKLFFNYVSMYYSRIQIPDIALITSSLFFSLIPLHAEESIDQLQAYYNCASNCLMQWEQGT